VNRALLAAWPAVLAALSLAVSQPACSTEAFCFDNCGDPTGSGGSGAGGSAGAAGTAGAAGSSVVLGGAAGVGGDAGAAGDAGSAGCAADLTSDPANCGTCGNKCSLPGAFPACKEGKCVIAGCAPGRHDLDGKPDNGCEYACLPTTPPTEVCDGVDNDCNGKVDEGSDLQNDKNNCGACGVSCEASVPNASGTDCVQGLCAITACAPGFGDANKVISDGCEYACPVNPPVAEECNGLDDDCDGNVDNGNPGGGQPCTETCPDGVCQGQCTPGTRQCAGDGTFLCIPGIGPSLETCDGIDNDCDGVIDDGFDLQTDPKNCGSCGTSCDVPNGNSICQDGACVFLECKPGFADLDSNIPGCEYACPTPVPGVEVCDGIDNDCNGLVDDTQIFPPDGFCNSKPGTPCEGTQPECKGALGWVCPYGPGVEVNEDGTLRGIETLCDGKDGNCDGQLDETFALVGQPCDDGKIGACRSTGAFQCNDSQDGIECVLTKQGQDGPQPEACDGVDNDCNGFVDDNLPPTAFSMVSSGSIQVDTYEASRPDATAASGGILGTVACSRPGVLPWVALTQKQAAAACQARGPKYRLCTAAELALACEGAEKREYPYGNSYEPATCNGADKAPVGALLSTGSLPGCVSVAGAFDLSGNVTEWTSSKTGETKTNPNFNIYQLHGGSYLSPSIGLECVISLAPRAAENAILDSIGFRCCKDP
jgi:hypothetical protein